MKQNGGAQISLQQEDDSGYRLLILCLGILDLSVGQGLARWNMLGKAHASVDCPFLVFATRINFIQIGKALSLHDFYFTLKFRAMNYTK